MDEPFASLDAQTREFMQSELLDIWSKSAKTVLFVTHQIDEAVYLSDRVLVMSARPGRLIADITVDIPRPRNLRVKRQAQFVELVSQVWDLLHGPESEKLQTADRHVG
jgi:NitT/TauT family transport system ATP-binding protein